MAKLPLSVLTLGKNQIIELGIDSLPTSLNILDLSGNLLEEVNVIGSFDSTRCLDSISGALQFNAIGQFGSERKSNTRNES